MVAASACMERVAEPWSGSKSHRYHCFAVFYAIKIERKQQPVHNHGLRSNGKPSLRGSHDCAKMTAVGALMGRPTGEPEAGKQAGCGHGRSPPIVRNADSMHDVAFHLAGLNLASLARLVSLVALPFAHEDLAIVLGAYIVVNDLMPTGLVVASIYGGMVVSDFALYGIGAGARRLPWLRKHAVDDRVHGF